MQYEYILCALLIVSVLFVFHVFLIKRRNFLTNERYAKLLVQSLPYGVFVTNRDGELCCINDEGRIMLGAETSEQLIGKSAKDFIHPDYIETGLKRFNIVKESDTVVPLREIILVKLDGSHTYVETMSIPFIYEKNKSILIIARDINIEKQARQLKKEVEENAKRLNETLEVDKLKTDFFANLSHELRTPLNMIFSTLQLFDFYIRNNNINFSENKIKKYISTMKQNCYRLLRLVNNLIDSTKIDSGFFEMQLQSCNITNVVEEITLSAAEYIKDKSIDLMFDTDVEEKYVECDPDKIERIILNLLSNAAKFTRPGGTIAVTIHDLGENVMITVKDTGIGIANDKLEVIFERFKQVDKSLTRDNQGSGIGLSLVKSLVEMHNGTISAYSEYGCGSEFVIKLPAKHSSFNRNMIPEKNSLDGSNHESHIERINIEFSDIYYKE